MDELELLHQQIAELTKRANEIAQLNKSKVVEEMKSKIAIYGITAQELGFMSSSINNKEQKPRKTSLVKYRNGDLTWSGHGRKPNWLVEHLANGGSVEDFAV